MKRTLISIILIAFAAAPCIAQWKFYSNIEVFAYGAHDTSFFFSEQGHVDRLNPNGEADAGIDFGHGNITTFASVGTNFFCGSGPPDMGDGYLSTNDGASWSDPIGGPVGTNGTYVFAQYASRIARSRDTGRTWEHLSYPAGNSYAGTGACIYTNTPNNGIWRSLDSGFTWAQIATPFNGSIMTMGTLLFVENLLNLSNPNLNNRTIIFSWDSGMHWDTLRVDSAGMPEFVSSLATDGKNLFAGGVNANDDRFGNGVYLSTDTGKTWRAENEGLQLGFVTAMGVWDSALWINIDHGAGNIPAGYVRTIREMTDSTKSAVKQTPETATTLSVYPNPMNSFATITYSLASESRVSITVIDALGRTVAMPIPGASQGAGTYSIGFDGSMVPSGMYWCRLSTGSEEKFSKFIIER
ncbi:MAG TPA: T9SS type A sorting domain-containing protein [Candidatus Kapabacteria bacterium]|nr:T9SS type A sorting domain-containing protein [Candidatus Kapabacteria bacterium]